MRHTLLELVDFCEEINQNYGIVDHSFNIILNEDKYTTIWLDFERNDAVKKCQILLRDKSSAYGTDVPMHVALFKRLLYNLGDILRVFALPLQKRFFEHVIRETVDIYLKSYVFNFVEFENMKVIEEFIIGLYHFVRLCR
jgi:hypothetical protein